MTDKPHSWGRLVNVEDITAYLLYGWIVADRNIVNGRGVLMVFPEGREDVAPPEPSERLKRSLRGVPWTNKSQATKNS